MSTTSPRAFGSARAPGTASSPTMATLSRLCALLGVVIGALALTGWLAQIPSLRGVLPGLNPMRANSVFCVLLLAVGVLTTRGARTLLAGLAALIAVLSIIERIASTSLGIDQLLIHNQGGPNPGRMAVLPASAVLLVAAGQLLSAPHRPRWMPQVGAFTGLLVCFVTLIDYAYDADSSVGGDRLAKFSVGTAVALFVLALATLAAIPGGALEWALTGRDAGAHLVRRLLPLTVVGLPLLGYVCVLGERAGWFRGNATSALIVVMCALAVGVFTWSLARRLSGVDRRRAQAIAELTDLRVDLERQVQERAEQLQNRHHEIAILEDRQRIAADLHDIVIQRLFAAGMYLQSGSEAADATVRPHLDAAVEAMDVAIKDMRASIFELGGRTQHPVDLATALDDVCVDSSRVLGFMPDVLIDDPEERADFARDDILAVLREALANVARHAEASAVDVIMRCDERHLWLTVTDDGRGITESARHSGTRNMLDRARAHGGDCTWARADPRGTRVLWIVPLPAGQ
jgi:signal transduction histidine kinase